MTDAEALAQLKKRIQPSARVEGTVKQATQIPELSPQGALSGLIEGSGIPAVKRTLNAFDFGPLGFSFNPVKYNVQNPNAKVWDMVGDLLSTVTAIIPGGGFGKTLAKTTGGMLGGAITGASIGAVPQVSEGLSNAMDKNAILQPTLLALQSVTYGRALKNTKNLAKTSIAEKAKEMGMQFSPEAVEKQLLKEGVVKEQKLAGTEAKISSLYPAKYDEWKLNQQNQIREKFKGKYGEMPQSFQEIGENIQEKQFKIQEKIGAKYDDINNIMAGIKDNKLVSRTKKALLGVLSTEGNFKMNKQGKIVKMPGGQIPDNIIPAIEDMYKMISKIDDAPGQPKLMLEELRKFTDNVDNVYSGKNGKPRVAVNKIREAVNNSITESIRKYAPEKVNLWENARKTATENSNIYGKLFGNRDIIDVNANGIFGKAFIQGNPGIDALIKQSGRNAVQNAALLKLYTLANKEVGFSGKMLRKELNNPSDMGKYKYIFGEQGFKDLLEFADVVDFVNDPFTYGGKNIKEQSMTAFAKETIKDVTVLDKGMKAFQRMSLNPSFLTKDLVIVNPWGKAADIAAPFTSGAYRGIEQTGAMPSENEALNMIQSRLRGGK